MTSNKRERLSRRFLEVLTSTRSLLLLTVPPVHDRERLRFPSNWLARSRSVIACHFASKMASVGFRWLDILEKEFDKAFVDLDLTVGEYTSPQNLSNSACIATPLARFPPASARKYPCSPAWRWENSTK